MFGQKLFAICRCTDQSSIQWFCVNMRIAYGNDVPFTNIPFYDFKPKDENMCKFDGHLWGQAIQSKGAQPKIMHDKY